MTQGIQGKPYIDCECGQKAGFQGTEIDDDFYVYFCHSCRKSYVKTEADVAIKNKI